MRRHVPRSARLLASSLLLVMLGGAGRAQESDAHALYETHCAGCHAPHARELVAEKLDLAEGVLVSRKTGQPVAALLGQGHGGLSGGQLALLVRQMTDIRLSDQLFYHKCATCHGRMRELARSHLVLRDGQIVGRYSGRDIAAFMTGHGRLTPEEVPEMLEKMRSHLAQSD